MNGSSKASSYFVPVKEGHGMWFDFNKLQKNDHDIAVVISVQGINPVTGQKSSALRLEKYENKCPVHDKEFSQDHFCKECGYKWPTQNYISTNATPDGQFWLDGFRSSDGKVRQYIFTEEQARGIAKAVIGDDRVFAIGIAFFKSKEAKPKPQNYLRGFDDDSLSYSRGITKSLTKGGSSVRAASARCNFRASADAKNVGELQVRLSSLSHDPNTTIVSPHAVEMPDSVDGRVDQTVYQLGPVEENMFAAPAAASMYDADVVTEKQVYSAALIPQVQTKSYEVGAGESIDQQVHADPNKMEYWQDEPFAMLYINYADEESVKKILAAGKRKEVAEGFLAGVPVGN
jgi:hypothetical protein